MVVLAKFGGFLVLGLGSVMVLAAADGPQLRKQRLPAKASVGAQALPGAQFEFSCHPARDGALSISLILAQPDSLKGFALDVFEGPDGAGEQRDLAQWSVDTRGDGINVKGPISGWYGVDGDGFVLSRAEPNNRAGALHQLGKVLADTQARRLRLAVSPPTAGAPLQAEVLLDGQQTALAELLKPCLKP
ncbi:hypothetical protein DFR29_11974 [Tahibacter aquaticus]|jgi:hypothetical protein|uniref:Uncharacterized protein n=1 Tax=Tahibacter aquaticus TaxID=520092 RepID=A0A4R6YMN6_9GAMM|nr:hypothetical protein [Tahibacter aquaticus]TDR38746.1 hypothetical protein DFR29_11974 [Tahibacter aquaticus]